VTSKIKSAKGTFTDLWFTAILNVPFLTSVFDAPPVESLVLCAIQYGAILLKSIRPVIYESLFDFEEKKKETSLADELGPQRMKVPSSG